MQENERYSRQMALPDFAQAAQDKLRAAKVLLIGVGGLGCAVLPYLVGAGVGRIGIMDADRVSLSNLHRQLLYNELDIGEPKVKVAANKMRELNSTIVVDTYDCILHKQNAIPTITEYDLVIDGTDNFSAKYLINDACVLLNKPWVYGAVLRYEGQVSVFNYGDKQATSQLINYRDLFPKNPPIREVLSCNEAGVLGILPGIIGVMQAGETIKIITGIGQPLYGCLLNYNLLQSKTYEISMVKLGNTPVIDQCFYDNLNYELDDFNSCSMIDEDIIEIDAAEFIKFKLLPQKYILDVREKHEYPIIDFADEQIPMSELEQSIGSLPEKDICIICHQGIRSVYAGELIRAKRNLKVYSLKGGVTAYFRLIGECSIPIQKSN